MVDWFAYFEQGGPLMFILAAFSVVGVSLALERLLLLRPSMISPPKFLETVKEHIVNGDPDAALELCEKTRQPVARIIEAGLIRRHLPREWIRDGIENQGKEESVHLEKHLGIIAVIAKASPLIGLLGTVTGMIEVFRQIAVEGIGNPAALSSGISQALLTTAAGLVVGIPALVVHHFLYQRSDRLIGEMERQSVEILELITLQERSKKANSKKAEGNAVS